MNPHLQSTMHAVKSDAALAEQLGAALEHRGWTVTAAESCTGGLIAATLTAVAGSSAWFSGSAVTYSNEVKTSLVGVEPSILEAHGAVSEQTVQAMALGACQVFGADVGIAVSGIAGPTGSVPGKPVGTVWIAIARSGKSPVAERHQFDGDRDAVRAQAVNSALRATLKALLNWSPEIS